MRRPPCLFGVLGLGGRAWLVTTTALLALGVSVPATSAQAVEQPARVIAPLASGDEPIVVTEHTIKTAEGPLAYETLAGRLPIRNGETGEVHGHIFFVAYRAKNRDGAPRPITFAWNGGPTVPSWIIHMGGFGPRLMVGDTIKDNPETLLRSTDLVFMDAMETGFSRLEDPKFAPEFFTLRGDVAATAEFVRAYRARLRATEQPVFIAGESYGVFRAAALSELMANQHERLDGTILISGDFPNIPQPIAFYNAMHIPARTATAFYYKRLPPDLMQDRAKTMKEVADWATNVYQPALEHADTLSDADKDKIIAALARYTGMKPEAFDRKTLWMGTAQFLTDFFGASNDKMLNVLDTRKLQSQYDLFGSPKALDKYLRDEVGYNTDINYSQVENGYQPIPGAKLRGSRDQFDYDLDLPDTDLALTRKYGEATWIARHNPPWIPNALAHDKTLRVFVATGRFDPRNMCEGDERVIAQLPTDESRRVESHCYDSGHVIYDDASTRHELLSDISHFIAATVAAPKANRP
jgi:carboxypeptidase C (cathepsin A)